MKEFKCVQRVFPIEAEKIEKAIKDYPDAFNGGLAVVTFNNIIVDDETLTDFNVYKTFFNRLKKTGVSMQVNLSSTIGHADQSQKAMPYGMMVGHNGVKAKAMACPRNSDFIKYLVETVKKYAELDPDVFWLDDDFRVSFHMPVKYGCFCENCLKEFSKIIGQNLTREEVVSLIGKDEEIGGKKIRKAWQDFNRQGMVDLTKIVASTIHGVNENIAIGFMQINPDITLCESLNYNDIINAAKNAKGEVYFRHGSGFYSDIDPYDVIHKNLCMARLNELTKKSEYNVKNYAEEVTLPYARRGKSMKMTFLESVLNIGVAGLDGIMDEGIKPNLKEQVKDFAMLNEMHKRSEYLNYIKKIIKGKKQIGIYPYFSPDVWQHADKTDDISKMNDINVTEWERLFLLGIPFTFDKKGACATLLSGKSVRAMDLAEVKETIKGAIYADGESALELNDMLNENVTGLKPLEKEANYPYSSNGELFTDHALNGEEKGFKRYNIWHANKKGLAMLTENGAEILSYALSKEERADGLVGTAIYENAYGGKVATFARGPWDNDIVSESKTNQIKNVLDYITGKMPVRIETPLRAGVSIWEDDKERIIFIYNLDFDDIDQIKVISDIKGSVQVLDHDLTFNDLKFGDEFVVSDIKAFSHKIVRIIK